MHNLLKRTSAILLAAMIPSLANAEPIVDKLDSTMTRAEVKAIYKYDLTLMTELPGFKIGDDDPNVKVTYTKGKDEARIREVMVTGFRSEVQIKERLTQKYGQPVSTDTWQEVGSGFAGVAKVFPYRKTVWLSSGLEVTFTERAQDWIMEFRVLDNASKVDF